eukprot:scaffold29976_cov70-Phaeocystis_antarctica.AAC.3
MHALKEGIDPVPAPLKGGPGRLVETCMISCDIRHVFPAAGGAVRSRHPTGPACAESRRAACAANSHDARPPTSVRLGRACSAVVTNLIGTH